MDIRSCKAKGRRLCMEVRALLLSWAPRLGEDDIYVTTSSVTGEDLLLSPEARSVYPYSFECKNRQTLNIWDGLKQAEKYSSGTDRTPLLIFSRNHAKTYVVLEFDKFLKLTTNKGA